MYRKDVLLVYRNSGSLYDVVSCDGGNISVIQHVGKKYKNSTKRKEFVSSFRAFIPFYLQINDVIIYDNNEFMLDDIYSSKNKKTGDYEKWVILKPVNDKNNRKFTTRLSQILETFEFHPDLVLYAI